MIDVVSVLARGLSLSPNQVSNALQLFAEGCTIPFIARYRKERTEGMNEFQLRSLADHNLFLRELEQRKAAVLKSIDEQGKLTDDLKTKILDCVRKVDVEDLYQPYRPKKKSRAAAARERGLGPLAAFLASVNSPGVAEVDLEGEAAKHILPDKGITNTREALAGAADILAEDVADKAEHRAHLREYILNEGTITSVVRDRFPPGTTKFEMYRDFKSPIKSIQPHNILALRRGERSGILHVSIALNEEYVQSYFESKELFAAAEPVRSFYRTMLKDAFERLMRDSLIAEIRAARKEIADLHSVKTFEANVRDVLLAPPAGMKSTMGVDPGFRSGCMLAVVDATGKLIEHRAVFPHDAPEKKAEAAAAVRELVERHVVQLIAIGNGTASRETDLFISEVLATLERKPVKVIVNESGASVYSTSRLAKEELPDLDVTVRRAVSIARRLQDPLTELVKIDPKSIGVGQYQHDVDQKLLKRKLDDTVESCVNYVGVDLNTASKELLRRVAGVNPGLAGAIVVYRNEHGAFKNREELHNVPQMGPKAYEQAAGFLRIRGGGNPLDNTGVHPERYPLVQSILADLGVSAEEISKKPFVLKKVELSKYASETVGEPTLRDILEELRRAGRDPRRQFTFATFKEGVKDLKDLTPGMELEGVVTNVTNFGAFVDVGVHHDGLVHVSQLADRYVADPKSVAKVGQVVRVKVLEVNEQQKRISLTMKGMAPRPARPPKKPQRKQEQRQRPEQRQQQRQVPPEPRDEPKYTIEDLKSKFNRR